MALSHYLHLIFIFRCTSFPRSYANKFMHSLKMSVGNSPTNGIIIGGGRIGQLLWVIDLNFGIKDEHLIVAKFAGLKST